MNIDVGLIVQVAIALGGGAAIYLIAKKKRFGFMLGTVDSAVLALLQLHS